MNEKEKHVEHLESTVTYAFDYPKGFYTEKEQENFIEEPKKLSKIDEMVWMEVFEVKKSVAQALLAEIDKTDEEIDKMVFELYDLTEDKIKIVEEG